jgi:hypothetical protein
MLELLLLNHSAYLLQLLNSPRGFREIWQLTDAITKAKPRQLQASPSAGPGQAGRPDAEPTPSMLPLVLVPAC